jgi:hypothetical protein
MKALLVSLLAFLVLARPLPAKAAAVSSDFDARLQSALSSGDWEQVKPLFSVHGALGAYVTTAWVEMRKRTLTPLAWEVHFAPFYDAGDRQGGVLTLTARLTEGRSETRSFDLELLHRGSYWLAGDKLPLAHQDFSLKTCDLDVQIQPQESSLKALETLKVQPNGPDLRMFLRLAPGLNVDSVMAEGHPLVYHQAGGLLYVERSPGSDLQTLAIHYGGELPERIRPAGTVLKPEDDWYAHKPLGQEADCLYKERLTVSEGNEVIGQGDKDPQTSFWSTPYPTAGLSLFEGPYKRFDGLAGAIHLAAFLPIQKAALAPSLLSGVGRGLAFLNAHYGNYPFQQLSLVQTESKTLASEPGVIELPQAGGLNAWQMGRVIAYHWTDPSRTQGSPAERAFMREAIASYAGIQFQGALFGSNAFRNGLFQAQRDVLGFLGGPLDAPLAQASAEEVSNPQFQIFERAKGALIQHMLKLEIGEQAFERAWRTLWGNAHEQGISLLDYEAAFDAAAGKSLTPFFSQWLNREGEPVITPHITGVTPLPHGQYELSGQLIQSGTPYRLTVPLVVLFKGGQRLYPVKIDGAVTRFRLRVPTRPTKLLLNPLGDLLMVPVSALAL